MPIPENVRRQAMDAVSHQETTAQIRLYGGTDVAANFSGPPQLAADKSPGPLTPEVRKQAMDAVSHMETRAQIQLVKDSESVTPPVTPIHKNAAVAEKIAGMHKSGQDADSVHRDITKDNFGR